MSGTLLITGVSPRPDATGEQYVTITGVIDGPTLNEYTVYQRMAVERRQLADHGRPEAGGVFAAQSRQLDVRTARLAHISRG